VRDHLRLLALICSAAAVGVDETTLLGAPQSLFPGRLEHLHQPEATPKAPRSPFGTCPQRETMQPRPRDWRTKRRTATSRAPYKRHPASLRPACADSPIHSQCRIILVDTPIRDLDTMGLSMTHGCRRGFGAAYPELTQINLQLGRCLTMGQTHRLASP